MKSMNIHGLTSKSDLTSNDEWLSEALRTTLNLRDTELEDAPTCDV